MRKAVAIVVSAIIFCSLGFAQSPDKPMAKTNPTGTIELRVGAIHAAGNYLTARPGNHFSAGFMLSYNPWYAKNSLLNRLTFRGSFDGAGMANQVDTSSGKYLKLRERLYFVNLGAGFDALRSERLEITPHFGFALARDSFSVAAQGYYGYMQSICSYYGGVCESKWGLPAAAGMEFRYFPSKNGRFFFGLDPTKFAGRKSEIVATIGYKF